MKGKDSESVVGKNVVTDVDRTTKGDTRDETNREKETSEETGRSEEKEGEDEAHENLCCLLLKTPSSSSCPQFFEVCVC